jgi:gephyrin
MATSRVSRYPMMDMADAWAAVGAAVAGCARRAVDAAVTAAVVGAVTAAPVTAPAAVPALPCSRLDGFAVAAPFEPGVFPVAARQRAGHASAAAAVPPGAVAWVTTGSPLPAGTNAVIGVEASQPVDAGGVPGAESAVRLTATVAVGDNVRPAGSDLARGAVVFGQGHTLTAPDVATLLSAGITRVRVVAGPRVGLLSSGDEIVDAAAAAAAAGDGAAPADGTDADAAAVAATNAVIDSNRPMLTALLAGSGVRHTVVDCGLIRDDLAAITAGIAAAVSDPASGVDVLVTTGGVSMGDRDFIKPAVEALAARYGGTSAVLFGRLNMKPGKPTTCAVLDVPLPGDAGGTGARRRRVLVFSLPGNPVSAFVGYHTLLAPAVRALAGAPWEASLPPTVAVTMLDTLVCDPERPEFHRATVWAPAPAAAPAPAPATAALLGRSTGSQASSRLASTVGANALVWVPKGSATLTAPVVLTGYMIGPLVPAAALPRELADPRNTRAAPPGGGGGCKCGMVHEDAAPAAGPAATASVAAASPSPQQASGAYPPHQTSPPARLTVNVGVLTVSDRCAEGATVDAAGPAVVEWLTKAWAVGSAGKVALGAVTTAVVPDDAELIRATVEAWTRAPVWPPAAGPAGATDAGAPVTHLVVTTGGTGMGPRDGTPEALRSLITRPAPGLVHAMLAASFRATPMAALSRYEAGLTSGGTLVVQLPGSPKAVRECLDALAAVLPHALALARGA